MELLKNKYFVNNFVQSESCKISCADYCDDVSYMSSDLTGRDTPIRSCGCKAQRVLGRERQFVKRAVELCSEFKYHVVCLSFINQFGVSHRARCNVIPWSTMLTLMCDSCLQEKNNQLVEIFDRNNPLSNVRIHQSVLVEPPIIVNESVFQEFPPSHYSGPIMLLKTVSGHQCHYELDSPVIPDDLHPKNVIFKMLLNPSMRDMYNHFMYSEMEYFYSSYFNMMYRPEPQCCRYKCNIPFKNQTGPLRFEDNTGALIHFRSSGVSVQRSIDNPFPMNGFDAIWGQGTRSWNVYKEHVKNPRCCMCKQPVFKLMEFSDHEEDFSPEPEIADLDIAEPFEDVLNWNAPRQQAVTPPPTFEVGEDQDGNFIYLNIADIPVSPDITVSPFLISDDEMPELSDEELLELYGYF